MYHWLFIKSVANPEFRILFYSESVILLQKFDKVDKWSEEKLKKMPHPYRKELPSISYWFNCTYVR